MIKALLLLLAFLVIAALIGVAGGIAYGNPFVALLCAFAVIIFMWIGFFVKGRQQAAQTKK